MSKSSIITYYIIYDALSYLGQDSESIGDVAEITPNYAVPKTRQGVFSLGQTFVALPIMRD